MSESRYVHLRTYPRAGGPPSPEDFEIVTAPEPTPDEGEVLLETLRISIDPYLRSCMTGIDDFALPQFALGEPVRSTGVARVIASRDEQYEQGSLVTGVMDWADRAIWSGRDDLVGEGVLKPLPTGCRRLSDALGVLGLTGAVAFFGVVAVARPRAGQTLLISGAAGAIGTVAGQIANLLGARTFGLAGSEAKCRLLVEELGFEGALDYRSPNFAEELEELIPGGPELYFDNVGGAVSQTVMWGMRRGTRVVECGQISTYGRDDQYRVDIMPIHMNGLRLDSFATPQFYEFMPAAEAQLAHWVAAGKLLPKETNYDGLESLPPAIAGQHRGENIGKSVVTIAEPD